MAADFQNALNYFNSGQDVQVCKECGNQALKNNDLDAALHFYNTAIDTIQRFPTDPGAYAEYHHVLCNRSLVLFRLKKYREAEQDAQLAITVCGTYIKSYWRAGQAAFHDPNGAYRALEYFADGLKLAKTNVHSDVTLFLAEICTVAAERPNTEGISVLLQDIELPDVESEHKLWDNVLVLLSKESRWKVIAMLFSGRNNPNPHRLCTLDTSSWDCTKLSVRKLLTDLGTNDIKTWGEQLALLLVKHSASIGNAATTDSNNNVIFFVETALKISSTELLKWVLEAYKDRPEKINAQDKNGFTAVHIVAATQNVDTTFLASVLKLLLDVNADLNVVDKTNKTPSDYVQNNDTLKQILHNALNPDLIIHKFDELKTQGNSAKTKGNYDEALRKYDEALSVAQMSPALIKKAAIIYNNKAIVLFAQKKYDEALDNALAAVNSDECYVKGYWWVAKTLRISGDKSREVIHYLLKGYQHSGNIKDKADFIENIVLSWKEMNDELIEKTIEELRLHEVKEEELEVTLERLSTSKIADWNCIALMILGTKLSSELTHEGIKRFQSIAGSCSTAKLHAETIIDYLKRSDYNPKRDGNWLDAVLYAIFHNGYGKGPSHIHTAAQLAVYTGRTAFLKALPDAKDISEKRNEAGDSVFHVIAKYRPPPEERTFIKIVKPFIEKGYSTVLEDRTNKLAVEFLDISFSASVCDLFLPTGYGANHSTGKFFIQRIDNRLEANSWEDAGALCNTLLATCETILNTGDYVWLHCAKAGSFFGRQLYEDSLKESLEVIKLDQKCFQGHFFAGRAYAKLNRLHNAIEEYIEAYNLIAQLEQQLQVQRQDQQQSQLAIIQELTCLCSKKNSPAFDGVIQRLLNIKEKNSLMWALTSYNLINIDMASARNAFDQFAKSQGIMIKHFLLDLKPLCNLEKLKEYPWMVDILNYFIDCTSDISTISCEEGDTPIHALVRMSLISKNVRPLLTLLNQGGSIWRGVKRFDETLIHKLDSKGNTPLHIAAMERKVQKEIRFEVVRILIEAGVDVDKENRNKWTAVKSVHLDKECKSVILAASKFRQSANETSTNPQAVKPVKYKRNETSGEQSICQECRKLLNDIITRLQNDNFKGGSELIKRLFKKQHKIPIHTDILEEAIIELMKYLKVSDITEIPNHLKFVGKDNIEKLITELANNGCLNTVFLLHESYRSWFSYLKLTEFNIEPVVDSLYVGQDHKIAALTKLIDECHWTLGRENGKFCVQSALHQKQYGVVEELVKRRADVTFLTVYQGDTPIHAWMQIALTENAPDLFGSILKRYYCDTENHRCLNPEQQDENGDSLFHLIAKANYNETSQRITEYLCNIPKPVSSSCENKEGKRPKDYLKKGHERLVRVFELAANKNTSDKSVQGGFKPEPEASEDQLKGSMSTQKASKLKNTSIKQTALKQIEIMIHNLPQFMSDTNNEQMITEKYAYTNSGVAESTEQDHMPTSKADDSKTNRKSLNSMNKEAPNADKYKTPSTTKRKQTKTLEEVAENLEIGRNLESNMETLPEEDDSEPPPLKTDEDIERRHDLPGQHRIQESFREEDEENASVTNVDSLKSKMFSGYTYEVEFTRNVFKVLHDRHVEEHIKLRIVRDIIKLANGEWENHLCKPLEHTSPTLRLYEAKISKAYRFIWELTISFSPRQSKLDDKEQSYVYEDKIRIWDIVLDHDKISSAVKKIADAYRRGNTCVLKRSLKSSTKNNSSAGNHPHIYTVKNSSDNPQPDIEVYPPASDNDKEFHILKFHSFDSSIIGLAVQSMDVDVDLPIEVSEKEFTIINIKSNQAIILMGRSGTGKTTCLLYRLWDRFYRHWSIPQEDETGSEDFEENEEQIEHKDTTETKIDDLHLEDCDNANVTSCKSSQEYNLRQLFITKNAVLTTEVRKLFNSFRNVYCKKDQMRINEASTEELPNRLQDIPDSSYPLFLTSKQYLLLLDASLENPFFERHDDGSVKQRVVGWTDTEDSVVDILDDDFDTDEETDYDDKESQDGEEPEDLRGVTYEVFVNEFWPKVKHEVRQKHTSYHVSLIWMEIISFIQGSYKCLFNESGHLSLEDYEIVGKKKAYNFDGKREEVYAIFEQYKRWKKSCKRFDETDVVRHIFRRLDSVDSRSISVHQIYVDETQDFTEVELYLLIRLCQNPNDMFFTGDTAQSIMRGIAFRFKDLKSLFHEAKTYVEEHNKTSQRKLPSVFVPEKIHQLQYNYRSHSGISSLASSVLDILIRFFPESIDRLEPDQGLFDGPKPVFIESCDFSDLAVLLSGNKRETSNIEFGAHQVILVVDEAARNALPVELSRALTLTIYESKGLEFDDVLLFNFFKDSQANKEWRAVIDLIKEQAIKQQEKSYLQTSEVACLDTDFLQSKGMSRPLNFDQNLHKVLNSELKHLYTALTRARANIFIFDGDREKRAPMFEYFKFRNLVDVVTVDGSGNARSLELSRLVQQSSPAEWTKQGDKYMKKFLYGPAAKCYRLGNNQTQENLARANELAVSAKQKNKQASNMPEDFVCAAELYLMCNEHVKAAKCLNNAKETELAIQLYEKLGMFKDAAEIYRKQKKYLKCSECYQKADLYNKAVRVLFDNKLFDRATDTLKLFEMRKQKLELQGNPRLDHVLQNKPDDIFTEEKISKGAALHYHETKNKERMFEAVKRFPSYNDRVRFLEKHGYIEEAVYCMEQLGKFPEAVDVCVKNGKFEKARELADKCTSQTVIAETILKIAKAKIWAQQNAYTNKEDKDMAIIDEKRIISDLEKAESIFVEKKDADNLGQVLLLQAIFRNDPTLALSAMNKFSETKNAAGEAECCFFLQSFIQPDKIDIVSAVIKRFDSIFSLCKIWIEGERREHFMTYCTFYGLYASDKDTFVIYPHLGSFCLPAFANKYVKQPSISKDKVCKKMAHYLMEKGQNVVNLLKETLFTYRHSNRVCNFVTLGTQCIENPCPMKHDVETKESVKQLLNADMLLIMFEATTNRRIDLHARLSNQKFRMNQSLMLNQTYKFQGCLYLYEDFLPVEGFSFLRTEEMESVVQLLRQQENDKVRRHIIRQLKDKWERDTAQQNLECRAVFETDIFLKLQIFYHIFRLKDLSAGVLKSPIEEITALETAIDSTLTGKPLKFEKNNKQLTVMFETHSEVKPVIRVLCLGRTFVEAYEYLYHKQPYDALVAFSDFQIKLSSRQKTKDTSPLPDASIYITWLELFTTLSLLLMTKLRFEENILCTVPNSFLRLIRTMDNFFPETTSIFQSVQEWKLPDNKQHVISDIQLRLGCLSSVISGYKQGVNLMTMVQKESRNEFRKYALLERCLILGMTMLCNVETCMPVENESRLINCFKKTIVPESAPQRLKKALTQFCSAHCTKDVAECLNTLTMERNYNEEVVFCAWKYDSFKIDVMERTDSFSTAFHQTTQEQGNDDNENNEQDTISEEETATRKVVKDDEYFIEEEAVKVSAENVTEMSSSVNGAGQTKLLAKCQKDDSFSDLDVAKSSFENILQSPNNSQNKDGTGIARSPKMFNSDTFVDHSDIVPPSIPISPELFREQHIDDILPEENMEEVDSFQKEFETEIMSVHMFLEDNKICDTEAIPHKFITCKEEIESMIRIKNDIGILILEMHNKRNFSECRREIKRRLTDLQNIHINVLKFIENEKLQSESNEIGIDSFSNENEGGVGKIESVAEEPKRRKYRTSREKKMERSERKLQKKKQ